MAKAKKEVVEVEKKSTFKTGKSGLEVNNSVIGESIEEKVRRMTSNNEPIGDSGAQEIYTTRGEGILPEYDIRTDKMEQALIAMDKHASNTWVRRSEKLEKENSPEPEGGESVHTGNETLE